MGFDRFISTGIFRGQQAIMLTTRVERDGGNICDHGLKCFITGDEIRFGIDLNDSAGGAT